MSEGFGRAWRVVCLVGGGLLLLSAIRSASRGAWGPAALQIVFAVGSLAPDSVTSWRVARLEQSDPWLLRRFPALQRLVPTGTMRERQEWSERHPWLVGFQFAVGMCLFLGVFFAAQGASARWLLTAVPIAVPLTWLLFSVLVKSKLFREDLE